jgi:hypothetical protein
MQIASRASVSIPEAKGRSSIKSSCASGNFLFVTNPLLPPWAIDISALQAFGCFVLGGRVLQFLVCVFKIPAEIARFLNRMVSISMTYASVC